MTQARDPFEGVDPVSTYSMEQAVEDGILVDLRCNAVVDPMHAKVAFATRAVWEHYKDMIAGVVLDITLLVAVAKRAEAALEAKANPNDDDELVFFADEDRYLWVARNEQGTYTLMFPEDY